MKTTLFTGHSLGGGLAACCASWSRHIYGITFNAAGVYEKEIVEWRRFSPDKFYWGEPQNFDPIQAYAYELSAAISEIFPYRKITRVRYAGKNRDQIFNYHTKRDFLTNAQETFDSLPKALGKSIQIELIEDETAKDRRVIELLNKITNLNQEIYTCTGSTIALIEEWKSYNQELRTLIKSFDNAHKIGYVIREIDKRIADQKELEQQEQQK